MGKRTKATTKYPNRYPLTTCKYVKLDSWIHPGTDMNVTPDKEVPTIPNATIYHLEFLLPVKKILLLSSFPVIYETANNTIK